MELAIGTEVVTTFGLGKVEEYYRGTYKVHIENERGTFYISKQKLHVIIRTEEEHANAVKQLLEAADTDDEVLFSTLADAIELYEKDIGRVN